MTRFQEKIYFRMWHQSEPQQPYISIVRLTSTIKIKQFSAQNRYKFLVNFFDEITISSDVLRIIDSQFFSQPTTCNSASGQISGG